MPEQYRIPKQKVMAAITFPSSPARHLNIYLSERAERHIGYERPSDLLNSDKSFLPATETDGNVVILNRSLIRTVEVEAKYEFDPDQINGNGSGTSFDMEATSADIEVALSDDSVIHGTISFTLPGSQRRVQDFMNLPEPFLVLRRKDHAILVNKAQIQKISIV